MKRNNAVWKWLLTCIASVVIIAAHAQLNPSFTIGTVTGHYNFNYNETPDNIVQIYPPVYGSSTGILYQWESSSRPLDGFSAITTPSASTGYSFTALLSQTTYYRCKATSTTYGSIYSNTLKISQVSVNWEDMNYAREHDVLVTGATDWKTIDQMPVGQKLQTTTYLDGMDRPIQRVGRETATPTSSQPTVWGDIVQFSIYDAFGNQPNRYLPYTTTTNIGKYKTTYATDQQQYFTSVYQETAPYSNTVYDNTPMRRIIKMNAPGTSWANSAGSTAAYDLNDATDNIQIWNIGYNTGDAPSTLGSYPGNTLHKETHYDENGKQVIKYYTVSGQLILIKTEVTDTHADGYSGWACIYSVYDDFGRLRYTIEPEAVNYLNANSWSFAGTNGQQVLNELCFRYEYDEKGRTILKKTPGADALHMIYDQRDRIVFMQDGNQAAKATPEWTTNLYDELDRVSMVALYHTTESIADLQNDINNATVISQVTITNAGQPVTDLVVDQRQGNTPAQYKASHSILLTVDNGGGFSSATGDVFETVLDPGAATPSTTVTTATYKNPISGSMGNSSVTTILKYLFYDDYGFTTVKSFDNSFNNTVAYSNSDPNVIPIAASARVLSEPTGSMIRVLGTNTFLSSTQYYDEKGRPIQGLEDNIKNGQDVTTTQYHFDGRELSIYNKHSTSNSGYTNFGTLTKNLFDKIGRVTSVQTKYEFGSNDFVTTASYEYDDVSRLKNKHLAPGYTNATTGKSELESLAYSYNIHGSITGINKDYALKTAGTYDKWGNYLGIYLGYDDRDNVFGQSNLNGQLAGQLWNTQGDDAQRRYNYHYDNAGRLVNASFTEKQTTSDSWANNKTDFSVSGSGGAISYDLNGNLLSMLQKGVLPGTASPVTMDDLQYRYASYSNKLLAVTDNSSLGSQNGVSGDFKDGSNGNTDDYVYDNNGNIVIDLNKNIKDLGNIAGNGIRYNYLDKPEQIRIGGKGTIQIVYDADGTKLQRIFTPESGTNAPATTTYVNQYVYTGNDLQYINFEEGRIRVVQPVSEAVQDNQGSTLDALSIDGNIALPGGKKGVYDYFIKDQQGNTRMILTEEDHTGYNTCSMETARAANEEPVFGQVDANGNISGNNEVVTTRTATPAGWQSNTSSAVSKLGKTTGLTIGPNSLLKVMAGDEISATTQYYYESPVTNSVTNGLAGDVVTSLVQSIAGGSATAGTFNHDGATAANIGSDLNGNTPFIGYTGPDATNIAGTNPKAYLTVLFFDERFNFVSESSGSSRVSQSGDGADPLLLAGLKAPKNGYAYVYVSNESDEPVYFDNLKVSDNRGRIIQEDHYYAFGLKIAAISTDKLGDNNEGHLKNLYLYQGAFSELDEDLAWNDFELRNYDPQTGRWIQQDPYDQFSSPYIGMGNDPVNSIDPDGGVTLPYMGSFLTSLASFSGTAGSAVTISASVGSAVSTISGITGVASEVFSIGSMGVSIARISTNAVAGSNNTPQPPPGNNWFQKWLSGISDHFKQVLTQSTVTLFVTPMVKTNQLYDDYKQHMAVQEMLTGTTGPQRVKRLLWNMVNDPLASLSLPEAFPVQEYRFAAAGTSQVGADIKVSRQLMTRLDEDLAAQKAANEQAALKKAEQEAAKKAEKGAAKGGAPTLEGAVKSNFGRFVSKMPANAKSSASFQLLDDGSYLFQATSPGKVPGSSALYQKWVNPQGETFKMIKTTFAPDGSIIHVKPKF